jgi:hypothetical protein
MVAILTLAPILSLLGLGLDLDVQERQDGVRMSEVGVWLA